MIKIYYNIGMNIDLAKSLIEKNIEKFNIFKSLLTEYNKKYNLTSILDENEVYFKHFLDSVIPQNYIVEGANCVEIGSGAGFPSLPLKFVRDDLKFTLIESTGKKCSFLNAVVDNLSLNGVQVLNIRAEEGGRKENLREKFDFATARAVARLNTLVEYCLPFVKVGGKFLAYKGDSDEEIEESKNAVKILGGEIEDVLKYELPQEYGKRQLIIIKKVSATPQKYPRGRGLERKNPL